MPADRTLTRRHGSTPTVTATYWYGEGAQIDEPAILPASEPPSTGWKALYATLEVEESAELQSLRAREAALRATLLAVSDNEYLARLITACHAHRENGFTGLDVFDRVVAGDHFQDMGCEFHRFGDRVLQRLGGLSHAERLELVPHLQRLGFAVLVFDPDVTEGMSPCVMSIRWDGEPELLPVQMKNAAERGWKHLQPDALALPVRKDKRPLRPRDNAELRFAIKDLVLANTDAGWLPGTISFTWWRHPNDEPGKWMAYEITLNSPPPALARKLNAGRVYAPEDSDDYVRARDACA